MPVEFTRNDACIDIHEHVVCGLVKLVMAYDGSGRRISKTRMRDYGNGVWVTELVTHYTGIGTEIRENIAGATPETKVVVNMPQGLGRYGIEDAVTPYSNINSFEWYLKNNLGSTMLVYGTQWIGDMTKADVGALKAAYDYRSFGEQVNLTERTDKVTENFTGKELDDEIALNYFGARYLDPMLGLWISVDNARQFDSPYLYVGNGYNPIVGADDDGLTFNPVGAAVGAVIGLRNIYLAQKAYYDNGGDSYVEAVGVGLLAYGASVAAGAFTIGGGLIKTTVASGMVSGGTSAGLTAAEEGFATGEVNPDDVAKSFTEGFLSGAIGGAIGYGVSSALGGSMTDILTGEAINTPGSVIGGAAGQAIGQVGSECMDLKWNDEK